jgi:bifunctional DNA primase/polymerase-like protein
MTQMRDAALHYAARGTPIFPVNFADKHPLTEHGFKDATTDVKQIRTWWHVWPRAMIAIPTGPRSGLWILDPDLDPAKGIDGHHAMARLIADHGPLPSTLTSITPRGGRHHLFRWQDQFLIRNSTSEIGPGIDVRGDGGYFVAPPSVRIDGVPYRWEDETRQIVEAPAWLVELALKAKPATNGTASRAIIDRNGSHSPQATSSARDIVWARAALERESVGLNSNSALNLAAFNLGQIVGGGALSEDEVRERLFAAAEARGLILDYGEPSVIKTINSGLSAGMAQPRYRPR